VQSEFIQSQLAWIAPKNLATFVRRPATASPFFLIPKWMPLAVMIWFTKDRVKTAAILPDRRNSLSIHPESFAGEC